MYPVNGFTQAHEVYAVKEIGVKRFESKTTRQAYDPGRSITPDMSPAGRANCCYCLYLSATFSSRKTRR